MNYTIKDIFRKFRDGLHSSRGHSLLTFFVFLVISAMLWWVTALNDEAQADVRMSVKITHVPDSITIVSRVPQIMSVSINAKGTQLMKLNWVRIPDFNIDFRQYRVGNSIRLTDTDLKSIARNAFDGANVIVISPDSINLSFTSQPPVILPVNPDYIVTPGPQATITGQPKLSFDSVKVYTIGVLPESVEAITTEPIRLNSINETITKRVALIPPANSCVVPDSIDLTFNVEPLIFKTRKVTVDAVNVPEGQKLITFPAQVEVMYMISVSDYKNTDPYIRVTADYNSINDRNSRMIKLRISEASDNLQNVHLASDSAEYYIEEL